MSEINYEDARIEGGADIFADVLKPDRTRPQVGQEPIPSPDGVSKYGRFVESMLAAQQTEEPDEDLLATVY